MRTTPQFRASRNLYALAAPALLALLLATAGRLSGPSATVLAQASPDCTQMPPIVQAASPAGYAVIDFTNTCGQEVPLVVDVATNEAEWETGLMGITNLPSDQGELFDFAAANGGNPVQVGFWMEDTPTNLSIAFVGSNEILQEVDDMQAETTNAHIPALPYLYAIEANQGWFAENNIQPGSQVDLSAALALVGRTPRP